MNDYPDPTAPKDFPPSLYEPYYTADTDPDLAATDGTCPIGAEGLLLDEELDEFPPDMYPLAAWPYADVASSTDVLETAASPEMLADFTSYREQMHAIDAALDARVNARDIPGYLKSGSMCHTFHTPDGRILKLPRILHASDTPDSGELANPPEPRQTQITARLAAITQNEYIEPLLRARGHAGLEQIVAATTEDKGGVVCEKAAGLSFDTLTQAQIDAIPVADYEALLHTFKAAADLNLVIDYGPGNFFYDPDQGFTIIDYSTLEYTGKESTDAEQTARTFGIIFQQIDGLVDAGRQTNYLTAYRNVFGDITIEDIWNRTLHNIRDVRREAN